MSDNHQQINEDAPKSLENYSNASNESKSQNTILTLSGIELAKSSLKFENNFEEDSSWSEKIPCYEEEIVDFKPNGAKIDQINDFEAKNGENDEILGNKNEEEEDDEDNTLSSEAMVDDIELILLPEEETEELPRDNSPKLVRVTEKEFSYENYDDDEEDECNFKKMEEESSDDERDKTPEFISNFNEICGKKRANLCEDENDVSFASSTTSSRVTKSKYYGVGVQTEISALDKEYWENSKFEVQQPFISPKGGNKLNFNGQKRLNWKSELTLLPSKTKLGHQSYSGMGGRLMEVSVRHETELYSQSGSHGGVAKFTSQDVLNSSSQFLKPSTLYRTRNLSRNLNQLGSSESSFILPQSHPEYSSTSTLVHTPRHSRLEFNYQNSYSAPRDRSFKIPHSSSARSFRSSLPDLSSKTPDGFPLGEKSGQRSLRTLGQSGSFGSNLRSKGLRKRSSSDDETYSLIDESERCLRSSIDLFLTDETHQPGYDYPYLSTHYTPKRYSSQPALFQDSSSYSRESKEVAMGSPFLPRKLSDMRTSKWAKVIMPDGQVSVVGIVETDEIKDTLLVHSPNGVIINIPFRKIVFAWKNRK